MKRVPRQKFLNEFPENFGDSCNMLLIFYVFANKIVFVIRSLFRFLEVSCFHKNELNLPQNLIFKFQSNVVAARFFGRAEQRRGDFAEQVRRPPPHSGQRGLQMRRHRLRIQSTQRTKRNCE